MASMNRGLNLPQIQRIMNDFEKESETMNMKEEMMSDAVDDVMDDELEDEEEEGNKILQEVLDEIGVGLQQDVSEVFFMTLIRQLTLEQPNYNSFPPLCARIPYQLYSSNFHRQRLVPRIKLPTHDRWLRLGKVPTMAHLANHLRLEGEEGEEDLPTKMHCRRDWTG
jgi:hypothetical protein